MEYMNWFKMGKKPKLKRKKSIPVTQPTPLLWNYGNSVTWMLISS